MITTIEQARKVQEQRVANGKQGYSKAVRTFLKRNLNLNDATQYEAYLQLKANLPHLEIKPKAKEKQRKQDITVNGADVLAYMEDKK